MKTYVDYEKGLEFQGKRGCHCVNSIILLTSLVFDLIKSEWKCPERLSPYLFDHICLTMLGKLVKVAMFTRPYILSTANLLAEWHK